MTAQPVIPCEILTGTDPIVINAGRDELTLVVLNTGDRPMQVGSHHHFAEANPALHFDREAAWGHRLAVLAGTAVRFEPRVTREVHLVALAGARSSTACGACGGALDGTTRGE